VTPVFQIRTAKTRQGTAKNRQFLLPDKNKKPLTKVVSGFNDFRIDIKPFLWL